MPEIAVTLIALAAAVGVFRLRPLPVLGILAFAAFLVPSPLFVPHLHSSYLTVQHLLVLAGVLRLLLVPADRRAARAALRPTPALVALLALVAYSGLIGIGFVPDSGVLGYAGYRLLDLLDQVGFLVVCLALVRQVADLRRVLAVAAGAVVASSLIAVLEHATGGSYGHWLFSHLPNQSNTDAAFPLGARRGSPRVRAGAEFALQFGWMSAMLLPALIAVALTGRHRGRVLWAVAGTALVTIGIYWSFTRSALGAVVFIIAVLGLFGRSRRLGGLTAAMVGAAIVAYLLVPEVDHHLSESADIGSVAVRSQRLAPIFHAVAVHPFRGLGLGDLVSSGFQTTDNSLLLEYAELGAIGVTLLFVMFVAAAVQTGRGLALTDPRDRLVAAACTTGVLTFGAGAMTFDAFTLLQDDHVLWLLVAVGTVLTERRGVPVRLPRPAPAVAVTLTALGLLGGGVAAWVAPFHAAQDYQFTTLTAAQETVPYDPVTAAEAFIHAVCVEATTTRALGPHVKVDCVDSFGAAGVGQIRLQAPTRAALVRAQSALVADLQGPGRLPTFRLLALDPVATGQSTVARTAPVWAPLLVLGLVTFVAWRPASSAPPPLPAPAPPSPARVPSEPAADLRPRASYVGAGR